MSLSPRLVRRIALAHGTSFLLASMAIEARARADASLPPLPPPSAPPSAADVEPLPPPSPPLSPVAPTPNPAAAAAPLPPPSSPVVAPTSSARSSQLGARPIAPSVSSPRGFSWDLNLELGGGQSYSASDRAWEALGRTRMGLLYGRPPLVVSLGATYELSTLSPATLGLQGEVFQPKSGAWFQGGVLFDAAARRWGFAPALGYRYVGVEAQFRTVPDRGSTAAVFLKLRLPVGAMWFMRDAP